MTDGRADLRYRWLAAGRSLTRRSALRQAALGSAGVAAFLVGCSSSNNNSGKPATSAAVSATTVSGAATRAATAAGASPAAGGTRAATAAAGASPAAAAQKKGGDYRFPIPVGVNTQPLDPHIALNVQATMYPMFADRLIEPDRKAIEPLHGTLVQKWEQVDPSTLNLSVRPGVNWQDGKVAGSRAFTAQDVAFNLQRIAGRLDPQRVAQFARASLLSGMDKADAVDANTVKVSFTTPNASFLAGLADFRNFVVSPEQVSKDPNFKDMQNFAGTGAYTVKSFDGTSYETTYVPNPKYWQQGLPYFNSVHAVPFGDVGSTNAAFYAGQIDMLAATSQSVRTEIQKSKPDAKIISWQGTTWWFFLPNTQRQYFQDVRVRKAFQLAFDYQSMLDTAYGAGFYDYTGPLPSGFPGTWTSEQIKTMPGWSAATKQQDLAQAKQLMTAAGFPNGKGLNFNLLSISATDMFPVVIQDQLQKNFSDLKLTIQIANDSADFTNRLVKSDFDAVDFGFAVPPGAVLHAQIAYRTNGSRNYPKFSDPKADDLIDKAAVAFDVNARNQLLGQLQQQLLDNMMYVPIGFSRQSWAYNPKLVGVEAYRPAGALASDSAYDSSLMTPYLSFA